MNKPEILREGNYKKKDLEIFKLKGDKFFDFYDRQAEELFEVKNPSILFDPQFSQKREEYIKAVKQDSPDEKGDWIFYPWLSSVVHTVKEEDYYSLRTNRNQNIITADEQAKLKNCTVSFAGLSVGSNIALNLTYSGIGSTYKFADFDILETTNLNRVRGTIFDLFEKKCDVFAKQVYEVNPYINIEFFDSGLTDENVGEFVSGKEKSNLIFEIIDDFKMKVKLREMARKHQVALMMMTNLGDGVLIDIERYDLNPNLELFNGKIDETISEINISKISKEDEKRLAIQIVEKKNIPENVLTSVQAIGKELVGRPQTMTTISVSSGIASYLTREILLGRNNESGRKLFKFSDIDF